VRRPWVPARRLARAAHRQRRAASSHFETPEGIHFININGSGMRRMPGTRPGDQNPSWSPDGRKLVFWHERGQRGDIYVANADGSGRRRLTSDTRRSHAFPDWSPDGRWIAFQVGRYREWQLFVMRPDGSGLRRITSPDDGYTRFNPAWSPTSKELVFEEWPGPPDLATINLDGLSRHTLPTPTRSDWAPSWAPNGRTIAFTSDAPGTSELYTIHFGLLKRLTRNNAQDSDPSWSPDGRYIVFTTGRIGNDEVYMMRRDGTRQRRVTRLPQQYACCADWRR
jgi:Tol biopolymer transport system component